MNEKIKQHLIAYAAKNNWSTDDDTLIEVLTEGADVYRKKISNSRWWYTEFIVTEIDGMLIGYEYASANRDEHVRDLGWEFDESTICEVEPVQKTVTVYEKVLNQPTGGALNMNIDPNVKTEEGAEVAAPAEQATEQESAEEGTTEG